MVTLATKGDRTMRKQIQARLEELKKELETGQALLTESVDLESQYGTLKIRAIRDFKLPAGEYGRYRPPIGRPFGSTMKLYSSISRGVC
jgi:hypothetical protein